jgi:hypothetical protein
MNMIPASKLGRLAVILALTLGSAILALAWIWLMAALLTAFWGS